MELASVQTDWDDVLRRQPDYICLAWVGVRKEKIKPEIVVKRPGWKELEAVKHERILVLEEELYCRPSPRLLAIKRGRPFDPASLFLGFIFFLAFICDFFDLFATFRIYLRLPQIRTFNSSFLY
ncbi:Uncharacterised protein [Mycobacteroides abscessus subsp. abscessus]|nr:Uncharacterised protein [Mycobacteroides abscessus subsp. abscessus]